MALRMQMVIFVEWLMADDLFETFAAKLGSREKHVCHQLSLPKPEYPHTGCNYLKIAKQ